MFLLTGNKDAATEHQVWTARCEFVASPGEVLEALTDPRMIARWAPVDFELDGLETSRLCPGCEVRVSGTIAGVRAAFDVEVSDADERGLELSARGPVSMDVNYSFEQRGQMVLVEGRVALCAGRGLSGQVLRAATSALLNAGVLGRALRRLDAALGEPTLAAA
jgi:hypothetical protein